MEDLRKLQLIEVETLNEIKRICEMHNLKYYLIYGTLIGAVRHSGFIPWDDDMDIAMPEEDYELFIKYASKELGENFFLHSFETDKRYFPNFIRIRRNNTCMIPDSYKNVDFIHNGVWVDIYPLHYAKSEHSIVEKIKFRFFRRIFNYLSAVNILGDKNKSLKHSIGSKIAQCFSLSFIIKCRDKCEKSCKSKKAKYYVYMGSTNYMERYYFPIEDFGEGITHLFEGVECKIPADYDSVLKRIYGDYMKLPPLEEQTGHLPIIFDLSEVEVSESLEKGTNHERK